MTITHIIKETGKELCFVRVPDNTLNYTLNFHEPYFQIGYEFYKSESYTSGGFSLFYKDFGGRKKYPKNGELKLIGLTKEIKDEQLEGIMPRQVYLGYELDYLDFTNQVTVGGFVYPTESLRSLMEFLDIDSTGNWVITCKGFVNN